MNWKEHIEQIVNSAKNKVVSLNVEKATISYTDKINKYEAPKVITGDEEISRAYLVNRLINELDYKPENIEIEKPYEISLGRKTKTHRGENDLILRDNKGDAFYVIEVKSPKEYESGKKTIIGQLFGIGREEARKHKVYYLCYYTTDFIDGQIRDKVIIIDFQKYQEYEDWQKAGEPSVGNILSPGYNKPKKQPKIKGHEKYDLQKRITKEELSALATDLHNVLWGGGGTTDSEIFYSLVNIILAKIQDESEREEGEEYLFQVNAYGENIENPEKVYERVNELYKKALRQKLNIKDEKQLSDARVINRNKFPLNKLVYTVQSLENYSFVEGRSSLDNKDILGDFFEQITRDGFKQNKGQFFTPTPIVKFICYALGIDELAINRLNKWGKLPYIIDPSVGSGTFLIEAMKIITKEVKYKQRDKVKNSFQVNAWFEEHFMPDYRENRWAREYLYGIDINFDLGTAAKVNMILHGDGASNIFVQDGLKPFTEYKKNDVDKNVLQVKERDSLYGDKEVNNAFDVVISNPPFSVNLDTETKRTLEKSFLYGNKKNSENLFIERWYQLLKEGGRLGVVLPESVFDTTENKYIRLFLFKYFTIKAVVSLPQLTFEPYTSTKTSLLFAQKKSKKEIEDWNRKWNIYSDEWSKLKTCVENYVKVYIKGKNKDKYPSIKDHTDKQVRENIERYLKLHIVPEDKKLDIKNLLLKYQEEIIETGKYDKDLIEHFGHVNVWWVFSEVSKELNYKIFMAEAENVGYKRTKRGEKPTPNDLYDEEIAPLFIPRGEILDKYERKIEFYMSKKDELNIKIKKEESKNEKSNKKRIKKWKDDLVWYLEEIERLTNEKNEVIQIIDIYYAKDKNNAWRLKEEYFDRLDETLLGHFKNGLLSEYVSTDVLIRKNNVISILDKFRKEIKWELNN
jgi:type I restriction enzyme M protein